MELQHVAFKIFVDGELNADWEQFINVFHGWVAAQSMPEMMIDVADYRHVPNGPGVVMVGHEADYYLDNTDGKPGLRFVCKARRDGDNLAQVEHAFQSVSAACARLEQEISGLRFSRTRFQLTVNDRAVAPNNAATRDVLKTELPSILESLFGGAEFELDEDPRQLAGAMIQLTSPVELIPR